MQELETQVAKIHLGNTKETTSFVFILAEQAANNQSELYLVLELPLFNPAALPDCERISNAIAASLRRSYRLTPHDTTFEDVLGIINEELGKLASLGQNYWIGKLNAVIAVKHQNLMHIATSGRINALLLRDGQFISVTESTKTPHPLKTFENFAIGKIKLGDIVIFSTNQLFNFLSIDRLRQLLGSYTLPLGAQQIIKMLEDNAGPDIAFGTLITQQVEIGTTTEEQVSLEEYTPPPHPILAWTYGLKDKLIEFSAKILSWTQNLISRTTKKITNDQFETPPFNSSQQVAETTQLNSSLRNNLQTVASRITIPKWNQFSRVKKFFFASILLLCIAFIGNIILTRHLQQKQANAVVGQQILSDLETLENKIDSSILYADAGQALSLYTQVVDKSKEAENNTTVDKQKLGELKTRLTELTAKIEHNTKATTTNLGTLNSGQLLIDLPDYLAVQNKTGTITSYQKSTGTIKDNALILIDNIYDMVNVSKDTTAVYTKDGLRIWEHNSGALHTAWTDSVPKEENTVGLAYYPTNSRVYLLDRAAGKITSFAVIDNAASKPTVSVTNNSAITEALDMAIDSSIYVLTKTQIVKFQSGKQVEIAQPQLITPFSGQGKIFTDTKTTNLYILDSGNKRIIVTDKKGNLLQTITGENLNNPTDFSVDEKNKTIYLLDGSNLLKLNF